MSGSRRWKDREGVSPVDRVGCGETDRGCPDALARGGRARRQVLQRLGQVSVASAGALPAALGWVAHQDRLRWVFGAALASVRAGSVAAAAPTAAPSTADPRAAPSLLLARRVERVETLDVERYLVSEKLDGVRAYWTGREILFRRGGVIPVPDALLAGLPAHPLDGELWLGRGRFDEVSALLRRGDAARSPAWQALRYAVFEWPGLPGSFEHRAQALAHLAERHSGGLLQAVEQVQLSDVAALETRLREVVSAGGEGLMLHRRDASYVTGRSEVLLKLKPEDDAEAVVIGHVAGHGRLAGQVGALRVRDAEGREFSVGSGLKDAERWQPPPVGATISYRHRGWTAKGLPRFATFWRVSDGG